MFLQIALITPFLGCTRLPFREEVASHETAESAGITKVVVETKNGSIDVRCAKDAKAADIEVTRFASGTTPEDARRRAEEIQVEVQRDSARREVLRIAARFPSVDGANRGASFRLTLPQDIATELFTANGEVSVTGATRDVRAETSNGRVKFEDIRGGVRARTSNGAVSARGIDGDVDVRSSNGEVDMERVGAASVKAETSNGRIRVVDARGDAILETSNGSVELRLLSVPARPTIKVTTMNGSAVVALPRAVNARLQMRTSNGHVDAALGGFNARDLHSSRHSVTATLNDGAGSVEIESSNGSATLQPSSGTP